MKKPEKIDLAKLYKAEYAAPKKPVIIELQPATYLAIEGKGPPGDEAFTQRIGALYAMAYTIKMTRKFAGEQDYTIGKLEGLWWGEDGSKNFTNLPKERWQWKLLIRTPEFVGKEELDRAVAVLRKRGKTEPAHEVRLETLTEGACVQVLHVGPYNQEDKTVEVMRAFAETCGFELCGLHHEIYLSDPHRVQPEKLKTILRCPIQTTAHS